MGINFEEGEEEVTSRKKTFIKRAIAFIKRRRRSNRLTRNSITRDRSGAHERLVAAFFTDDPMYGEVKFQKTFRMARSLFNEIVTAVIDHDQFFWRKIPESPWGSPILIGDGDGDVNRFPDGDGDGDGDEAEKRGWGWFLALG
ncbi:hypothetical protein Tco_0491049 [Tanacetum coccineum]